MKSRVVVGIALFASVSVTSSAFAQEPKPGDLAPLPPAEPAPPPPPAPAEPPAVPPEPPPFVASSDVALNPVTEEPGPRRRRLVFSAGLGYTAGGSIKHPELLGNGFSGEMLELAAGLELDPKWHLELAFTSFQTKLDRVGTTNQFRGASLVGGPGVHPLVSCPDCIGSGGQGSIVVQQPLHVHTLGPRLDYLPFGTDSLYVGVTAGAAMMQDLSFRGGFAAAARAGFEWRPYPSLGLALEAGAHGQIYSDSSAALPYGALQLRLLAPLPSTSRYMTITNEPAPPSAPPSSIPGARPPPAPYR
jgi:hypothetical protein